MADLYGKGKGLNESRYAAGKRDMGKDFFKSGPGDATAPKMNMDNAKAMRFAKGGSVRKYEDGGKVLNNSRADERLVKNEKGFRSSYAKAMDDHGAAKAVRDKSKNYNEKLDMAREMNAAENRGNSALFDRGVRKADRMDKLSEDFQYKKGGAVHDDAAQDRKLIASMIRKEDRAERPMKKALGGAAKVRKGLI